MATRQTFTPRDVSDAERRARIGLILKQASELLLTAQAFMQLGDYCGDGATGYGRFNAVLSKLGDIQGNVKGGPDV